MNQHLRPAQAIPFIDIAAQRRRLGKRIDDAVGARADPLPVHQRAGSGASSRRTLAAFSGAKHVVTCASGTDALLMVLMAKKHRPAATP